MCSALFLQAIFELAQGEQDLVEDLTLAKKVTSSRLPLMDLGLVWVLSGSGLKCVLLRRPTVTPC